MLTYCLSRQCRLIPKQVDQLPKESLRVAEILADNDASYLNVFDNGGDAKPNELDFLLQRIRHSAVALFEMQNDL